MMRLNHDRISTIKTLLLYFFIMSIFLIVILSILAYSSTKIDLISNHPLSNIGRIYSAAIIILTIILACIGWFQFDALNKTSRADFLLRIDYRYSSTEIIKARAIIQELYRKASPKGETTIYPVVVERIAKLIKEVGQSENKDDYERFAYLLNLLDFLEVIALFCRKKLITTDEVDELLGNSIIFFYDIFRPWIYYRRSKYMNKYYHCELEWLIEEIQAKALKEKSTT